MKTQLVQLSKTAGWIACVLGGIHTGCTFFVVREIAILGTNWQGAFLFMYVAAGLGCLLAGSCMLLSTRAELYTARAAQHIFMVSAVFMLLLGIGAPIAMRDNPFGYITLALGAFAGAVAVLRYR